MAATKTKKKSTSGKKQGGRRVTLTFGWSGLISTLVLTGIALVWAFIFGVIIGRGYYPETLVPALSRVVPQQEQGQTPSPQAQRGEPLHAEELGFINSLDQREKQAQAPENRDGQKAEEQAPGEGEARQTERQARAAERYEYRYQVAALQAEDKARKVVRELKEKGMRVNLREVHKDGVTWYRIHVRFTGGPKETESFKQRLKGYGLGTPFLRDKAKME
ncbi:MAG: SPOR domain-containing protein [Desulfohalobiaceae bacterium]